MNDEHKRNDVYIARIECILANINRDSKTKPQPFKVEDFLTTKEKKKQTANDMATVLKILTLGLGGEIEKNG